MATFVEQRTTDGVIKGKTYRVVYHIPFSVSDWARDRITTLIRGASGFQNKVKITHVYFKNNLLPNDKVDGTIMTVEFIALITSD